MELFRKKDLRFYWYDFKVCGKRYRRSTKETNQKSRKDCRGKALTSNGRNWFVGQEAPSLQDFSTGFLNWVESAVLTRKSKKYYCNGWRLLSKTHIGACAWIT